jgi:hypothetical protein
MADVFHVAPQTVRGWLVECRKRGLLPPAQPGKAGTTPAAKATTPTRKPAAKNTTKNGGKK